jgi:hypothetical protein
VVIFWIKLLLRGLRGHLSDGQGTKRKIFAANSRIDVCEDMDVLNRLSRLQRGARHGKG